MERITVRVDEQLKRELEEEAREKGVSPSDIVRDVLAAHINTRPRKESALDIAKRLGIVGIYKNTPPDLSTNPEHMDGFGRE